MLVLPEYGETGGFAEDTLRSHLSLMHGQYVYDVKTIEGLIECHTTLHADGYMLTQHTHSGHKATVIDNDELEVWEW